MTVLTSNLGFLTPEGQLVCQKLKDEAAAILATQTEEIHLRTLGCAMKALLADEVSNAIRKLKNQ